jgi:plasmid stabilization system protein ParE
MSYSYLFSPRAAEEYEDAFEWYQERSAVAADNLLIEVEETIRVICKDPYRYRKTHKDLQELSLKKYPYYLIYLIDDVKKIVTIISLFHHKRNPANKYRQ